MTEGASKRFYIKTGNISIGKDKLNKYDISDHNSEELIEYCNWENFMFDKPFHNCITKDSDYYLPLQNKYNLTDIEEAIKTLSKDYSFYLKQMEKNYSNFKTTYLSIEDKKACALALSYYTFNKENSDIINKNINVLIRGEDRLTKEQNWNSGKIIYPIIHYLFKALANLPNYIGYTITCINVEDAFISNYEQGTMISLLKFTSSVVGKNPQPFLKKRNTWFYIYSLNSKDISEFIPYSEAKTVLYNPLSFFLVFKKEYKEGKNIIYMRQIEIGLYINNIIWINKNILSDKYENKDLIEKACSNKLDFKIIPKISIQLALDFIRNSRGFMIQEFPKYKILFDINKNNDPEIYDEVADTISNLRRNHFAENEIIIYTSSSDKVLEELKRFELDKDKYIYITESSKNLYEFLISQ